MGSHIWIKLQLLIFIYTFISLQIKAQGSGSILFLDSLGHRYLRTGSSVNNGETNLMSPSEAAAAISVLLGFAPPASLQADSYSKLDDILLPNPFDRPCAVFMLEVKGIEDSSLVVDIASAQMGSTVSSWALVGATKAEIELSDENEVAVVSLDEPLGPECDDACSDQELRDLAYWLGGSYVGTQEQMNGELTIPLACGSPLTLHVSKNSDRTFAMALASLVRNVKRAVDIHGNFAGSLWNPAELVTGCFAGFEALQEEYGSGGIAKQGMELFLVAVTKLFDSLKEAYRGHIVGVILINGKPYHEPGTMLDVKIPTRTSRLLEEAGSVNETAIVEVLLVRKSLAWITGVILLVSTLIGVYLLVNMPLTRDTLLYSNVKLD